MNIKELFRDHMNEYCSIKGKLLSASGDRIIKTILVTSCYPYEGKTTASLCIAQALSEEIDYKVLLIDGNFRSPALHTYFNIKKAPGFSDLFLTASDKREKPITFSPINDNSLIVMPNGSELTNPLKVLSSEAYGKELKALGNKFNYVIIDGTSIFGFSDILVSAKHFDGIVLVVEFRKTRWEVLQEAKDKLTRVGGKILGVVLNKRIYYIPKAIYEKV